jgi:hypothetical protein
MNPATIQGSDQWFIRVIKTSWESYLSSNRDFYKIIYITKSRGLLIIGRKTYCIDVPVILFLQFDEIFSWHKLSTEGEGVICYIRQSFVDTNPLFKDELDKYQLFSEGTKSVVRLSAVDIMVLEDLFWRMGKVDTVYSDSLAEDALQAYLLLLMVTSSKLRWEQGH